MNEIYEVSDTNSCLEYMEKVSPVVFEKIKNEFAKIDIAEKDFVGVADFKKKLLAERLVIEAFKESGADVILYDELDTDFLGIKKIFSSRRELRISGKYKILTDRCQTYCPDLETLVFEEGIITVGDGAFRNNQSLRKVVFPESLVFVNRNAFENCSRLEDVIFLNSQTSIQPSAFCGTKWFENFSDDFVVVNGQLLKYNGTAEIVTVPEGVKEINFCVFESNEKIRKLVCPSTLEVIGVASFSGCTNLEEVVLNNEINTVSALAFVECPKLKELILPEGIVYFCCEAVGANTTVVFRDVNSKLTEHITKWFKKYKIVN